MSQWKVLVLDDGGHQVLHHDHETGEWSESGTFPAQMTLGDLLALITEHAADGDFILLPDGSPVVLLDVPDETEAAR
jgi:hypothetical protein